MAKQYYQSTAEAKKAIYNVLMTARIDGKNVSIEKLIYETLKIHSTSKKVLLETIQQIAKFDLDDMRIDGDEIFWV